MKDKKTNPIPFNSNTDHLKAVEPKNHMTSAFIKVLPSGNLKLYRIQSIKRESLWYSFDGKFKDKLKDITGQTIPMPFNEVRQWNKKLKLLSAVKDIESFTNWFTKDQINMLFNSGYSLFEYQVKKGIVLPKGEILFDYNNDVLSSKETQQKILSIL